MVPPSMVRAKVTSCAPSADGPVAVGVSGVEAGRTKKKSATNTSRRTGIRIIALRTGSSSLGSGRPPSGNTANMPADPKLVEGRARRRAYTTSTARGSGAAPLPEQGNASERGSPRSGSTGRWTCLALRPARAIICAMPESANQPEHRHDGHHHGHRHGDHEGHG